VIGFLLLLVLMFTTFWKWSFSAFRNYMDETQRDLVSDACISGWLSRWLARHRRRLFHLFATR
jgi:hypothetical protein